LGHLRHHHLSLQRLLLLQCLVLEEYLMPLKCLLPQHVHPLSEHLRLLQLPCCYAHLVALHQTLALVWEVLVDQHLDGLRRQGATHHAHDVCRRHHSWRHTWHARHRLHAPTAAHADCLLLNLVLLLHLLLRQ
jgi:hypothetical protein